MPFSYFFYIFFLFCISLTRLYIFFFFTIYSCFLLLIIYSSSWSSWSGTPTIFSVSVLFYFPHSPCALASPILGGVCLRRRGRLLCLCVICKPSVAIRGLAFKASTDFYSLPDHMLLLVVNQPSCVNFSLFF